MSLHIGVGSTNPVKVSAVLSAVEFVMQKREDKREFSVHGYEVESGVSAQPFTDEETRAGARNRAKNVLDQHAEVDIAFGLEGGVMRVGDEVQSVVWVHIEDRAGESQSLSGNRFALPQYIVDGLETGAELGDVMDEIEGKTNTKHGWGMFGFLTEGVIPRELAYVHLVQFCFALWMSERM